MNRFTQRTSELWNYLRVNVGLPLMILIAVTALFFIYATIRDWQTRREIEATNARMDKYDEQANKFVEAANRSLVKADESRAATLELFAVVKSMSDNIEKIAKSDKEVTVKVQTLNQEYEKSRNQKRSVSNPDRARLSMRRREDDALAADRQLYPND